MASSTCPRLASARARLLCAKLGVAFDFQGLAVMGDGVVDLSAADQGQAEVVVGEWISRGTSQRLRP